MQPQAVMRPQAIIQLQTIMRPPTMPSRDSLLTVRHRKLRQDAKCCDGTSAALQPDAAQHTAEYTHMSRVTVMAVEKPAEMIAARSAGGRSC